MVLQEHALVLNRSWTPVGTTSVRAALCLLFRAAARAVLPHDATVHDFDSWASLLVEDSEPCVRTVRYRLKVPEILLLTRYDAIPRRRITFSRRNIYRRDRWTDESGVRLLRVPREPSWSPCLTIPRDKRKESWEPYIPEAMLRQEI
jgi:hypothetical protein